VNAGAAAAPHHAAVSQPASVATVAGVGTIAVAFVRLAKMPYVPLSVATFYRAQAEGQLTLKRATCALVLGMVVANIPLRIVQYAFRYA